MFKRTKTGEISFLTFVLFISVFCFLLDFICSVEIGIMMLGNGQQSDELHKISYGLSLYNQLTFYSVWTLFINMIYAIYRIVLNDRKYLYGSKMQEGHWSDVIIILINMVAFSLYAPTFAASIILNNNELVSGSSLDYQIVKSSLEHVILPLTITTYLLVFAKYEIDFKEFFAKRSWYPSVGVGVYSIYVISMFAINEGKEVDEYMIKFPYAFIAPDKVTYMGTIGLALLAVVAHFGATVGLVWVYNKTSNRNLTVFNKKININVENEDEKIEA